MKIYYTSNGGFHDELEQVCPCITEKPSNGIPIYVGSIKCQECPYCYGAGLSAFTEEWCVIPKNMSATQKEKIELGLEQFSLISKHDYIKCAQLYNSRTRNKFSMRFKVWWWHKVGIRLQRFLHNLRMWYYKTIK